MGTNGKSEEAILKAGNAYKKSNWKINRVWLKKDQNS